MIGLGLLDPCSVLGLIKDYPSENLAQNWTIQQLGYVHRWAKKAEKLMDETGKFCQATLQWANSSVGASRPSTRYPLSGRIYCKTENPREGSQLFSQEQWSIREGFPCARNELWLCLKGLVQSWKCPHLQGSSLQLMNTKVYSINVPKGYQCQGNQRPTSNTGLSKLQACRNCGWGTHPWGQCSVKNVTCHFCQN